MRNITTRELDDLTRLLDWFFYEVAKGYPRRNARQLTVYQDHHEQWIADLHRHYKPTARPYAWLTVYGILRSLLYVAKIYLHDLNISAQELQLARQKISAQRKQIERLQAQLQAKPKQKQVVKPAEVIEVTRTAEQSILYVMGKTGWGRKWRIAERVQRLTTVSEGTIRNGFTALRKDELILPFTHRGKSVRYKYGLGRRDLLVLSEKGKLWYQHAYQCQPQPSELAAAVKKHKGVQHAVDILEVRDLLRALDFQVDADPAPLLAANERWGHRAEPDLVLDYDGHAWPVEVQREVSPRNHKKWNKVLRLGEGRLIIVVETVESEAYQISHLEQRWDWRASDTILVTSLETLRHVMATDGRTDSPWRQVT